MMTPFPPKTVMQMRREAEQGARPRAAPPPAGPVDPAQRPRLHAEDDAGAEVEATADWLAHIAAGRMTVR